MLFDFYEFYKKSEGLDKGPTEYAVRVEPEDAETFINLVKSCKLKLSQDALRNLRVRTTYLYAFDNFVGTCRKVSLMQKFADYASGFDVYDLQQLLSGKNIITLNRKDANELSEMLSSVNLQPKYFLFEKGGNVTIFQYNSERNVVEAIQLKSYDPLKLNMGWEKSKIYYRKVN